MSEEVREDVVRRLQACHLASVRELEDVVSTYEPTPDEINQFARWTQRAMLSEGLASGALREDTSTILDMNQRAMMGISAVFRIVHGWWERNDNSTPLGSVLKRMPQEEAARAVRYLAWAGLLPEDVSGE